MATQRIGIDCAPGAMRPGHLLSGVLEGTDLDPEQKPASMVFGAWQWFFEVPDDRAEEIKEIIKTRISELYDIGWIRGGQW